VVVVGAHLDSANTGPGINDNGSGAATILEIALQMAALDLEPSNRVRFAWWGAEEYGLLGSEHYVSHLAQPELKDIALNLNFDMVGSPNYVRFVLDGDGSDTEIAGPMGSAAIEEVFLQYLAGQGLETEPGGLTGGSDYASFAEAGIPVGDLFTGAGNIKTEEEALIYGGIAGEPYDPCYHLACDTIENINGVVLDQMGDAAAHAVLTFAMTTSLTKGEDKASERVLEEAAKMEFRGPYLRK
jgi:Zn-dependent M28 family amino/carboxypeptidase